MARILNFTVIDVETANSSSELRWSICQVGITVVESGKIVRKWSQLIDPQINYREWRNTRYNGGIRPADVRGKPTFKEVYPRIKRSVASGRIVSHYSSFDENVVQQACERLGLPMFKNEWRDSWALARETWRLGTRTRGKRVSSHSLPKIAPILGIRYNPHDAGEDSRAAAELVLLAARKIGAEEVNKWLRGG